MFLGGSFGPLGRVSSHFSPAARTLHASCAQCCRLPQRCHKVQHDFHRKISCVGWTRRGRIRRRAAAAGSRLKRETGEKRRQCLKRGDRHQRDASASLGVSETPVVRPHCRQCVLICGRTGTGYFNTCRTSCVGADVVLLLNILNSQPAARESNKCIRK